jgi:hypothetical protein
MGIVSKTTEEELSEELGIPLADIRDYFAFLRLAYYKPPFTESENAQ